VGSRNYVQDKREVSERIWCACSKNYGHASRMPASPLPGAPRPRPRGGKGPGREGAAFSSAQHLYNTWSSDSEDNQKYQAY